MTDASQLSPELLAYLAKRATGRAARADVAWNTLTRYERRVVKDAAVMGFVLGDRHGRTRSVLDSDDDYPTDMTIVQNVLEHCDSTADLYPYLGAACNGQRRRVTRKRLWPGEETSR